MAVNYGKITKSRNVYKTHIQSIEKSIQNSYPKYVKEMYDDILDQKYLLDDYTKNKVYRTQDIGYKSKYEEIESLRRDIATLERSRKEMGLSTNQLTRHTLELEAAVAQVQPRREVEPDKNGWLVPIKAPEPPRLNIDPDLRKRGIEILRLALSKPDRSIAIARQVREIMGMNFIGNLPWEAALDWEVCKALKDVGLLARRDALEMKLAYGGNAVSDLKIKTSLDANGQTYTDVYFRITDEGVALIDALNEADPGFMLARNHALVGEAGMRALQIFYQHQGVAVLSLGLDLLDADRRLQKLITLELLKINSAEINVQDRQYRTSLTLTAKGAQMVKLALESGWTGWSVAPWETQRETKALKYLLEMLARLEDEVVDYQAQVVVMPQIASTRRGRGGFGMTARRYGGQVGEHTSFRWVGRKTTQTIELWQPEIEDAELEEIQTAKMGNVGIGTTHKIAVYTTATAATTNGTVVRFPVGTRVGGIKI
jgi:hypothetical protein